MRKFLSCVFLPVALVAIAFGAFIWIEDWASTERVSHLTMREYISKDWFRICDGEKVMQFDVYFTEDPVGWNQSSKVPIDNLSIVVRTDGLPITTISGIVEKRGLFGVLLVDTWKSLWEEATIFVPTLEDARIWNEAIQKFRREDGPEPTRVLPVSPTSP